MIGANFGDEGKGIVTDYLCRQYAPDYVVRFNGGANAGHTVVTPEGERHIFRHFGSGSFLGIPTYLSQFFVCNPILFFQELKELHDHNLFPLVYAHPDCKVTTYVDMVINQTKESNRTGKRHGSCGIGIHETMNRSQIQSLSLTVGELWNTPKSRIETKVAEIADSYARFRIGKPIDEPRAIEMFLSACEQFAQYVSPMGMAACSNPLFEGAQGLLLDQDNKDFYPHLTHSKTGMHNVLLLCAQAGITNITPYYVSRTYLTRHGAGRLPGEDVSLQFEDDTNKPNEWQGSMRFAPLESYGLVDRCEKDSDGLVAKLVLTHHDQLQANMQCNLLVSGNTRDHVEHGLHVKTSCVPTT